MGAILIRVYSHPILAAFELVALALLLLGAWIVLAAALPAVTLGRYRGQTVTQLDSSLFFLAAFLIPCAGLAVWMAL